MIVFYLGFYGWLIIIAATVYLNYYRIDVRNKVPTYLNSNWSRGVFAFVCLVLMTIEKEFDPAYLRSWATVWPEIVYIGSSFYLLFDSGLNGARHKSIDYQGRNSGWLDSVKKPVYYSLKLGSFIGLIISLIKLF